MGLPVPGSHWPLCPWLCGGRGEGCRRDSDFLVVPLGSVGCIPCIPRGPACPQGPACLASHVGLLCSWKAADSLGSALAEAGAWLETLLILSQHRHCQAAQPQTHPMQMLLDEALWKMVRDLLALQTRAGDWRLLAREVPAGGEALSEERQGAAGWTGAVLCTGAVAGNQTTFACTRVAWLCGGSDPREDLVPPLGWKWEPLPGIFLVPPQLCSAARLY